MENNLNSFLTSSLNVELVYTILQGITHFVNIPQLETWLNNQIPANRFNDYSIQTTLHSIKIADYKVWEHAHQSQFIIDPNDNQQRPFDLLDSSDELVLDKQVRVTGYFIQGFQALREADGISPQTVSESLDTQWNRSSVFKAGEASGASGSFFFFSHDRKFIIKTITREEKDFFIDKVATEYFQHLFEQRQSLLARIYGVYTVHINGHQSVHLLLMAHSIQTDEVLTVFDLKGSSFNREVQRKATTLKDTNYIHLQRSNQLKLKLSKGEWQLLTDQLERDSVFLRNLMIMDYSLLLAVTQAETAPARGVVQAGGYTVHVAVIDYLQKWNLNKKTEQAAKVLLQRADVRGLSCIEPFGY